MKGATILGTVAMTGKRKRVKEVVAPPHGGQLELVRAFREENDLLRSLANLIPEAIMIQAPDGRVTFANEALRRMCGGVEPERVEQACCTAFGGEIADLLTACCARAMEAGDLFVEEVHGQGHHIVVASRAMGPAATALRLWAWTDQREPGRPGDDKRHLEAVNLFATGIAHNFNNLLGGISGAIDALERIAGEDTRAQRCVEMTRRCVDDAIALTRKMSGAHRPPHAAAVTAALEEVVRSVVDVQQILHSSRVAFEVQIPPGLPQVEMGWEALIRVVQNLVQNSVEAINDVGWVTISARLGEKPGTLAVKIADNGVGMEPDTLARVYEPFFTTKSLDRAHGVATDGSGLGLWNVYQAVQLAGGHISMVSRVGEGTIVELILPAAQGAAAE